MFKSKSHNEEDGSGQLVILSEWYYNWDLHPHCSLSSPLALIESDDEGAGSDGSEEEGDTTDWDSDASQLLSEQSGGKGQSYSDQL